MNPLVELCGQLIRELNEKYAGNGAGSFAMFHRHRVYSPREGVWMGWERKRGKLLDFNRLILGQYDSFPYKVGDLSVLPQVRYVLTMDADTELPRGTAQRLIGTLAHPLCQADRRSSQCCHPGLRNSAAACGGQYRKCGPVPACIHLFRAHRLRHLYARDLRRISGPLRRGNIRWQGPVRCADHASCPRSAFSAQCHPEP